MDVAEFFVVRGARARGVGRAVVRALFARFDAPWEIRVRQSNPPAQKFWSRVVSGWQGVPPIPEPFVHDGVSWNLLRVSRRAGS
jgi:predicted acetyltransferase